jgi:hypothetical protein
LRGTVDHNDACKRLFDALGWDRPTATESCRAKIFIVRALISVNLFSQTEAEAMCLFWRMMKKMLESFGLRWVRLYHAESHTPTNDTRLFGGPANTQANHSLEKDRQTKIDRMAQLFHLPAVSALADETALR